jgi:glutaredoxin-like protein NrdH
MMIEIYTKNNCQPCKMTKNWFRNNGIVFHETNVDEDLDALAYLIENNLRTAPVVFDGSELVSMGFTPNKWEVLK